MAAPIGKRYARALLELAQEQSQVSKVGNDLADLEKAWNDSAELRSTFENPAIAGDVRRKILDDLASRMGLAPTVKTTLFLLSDRRRMRFLPDVVEAFRNLSEDIEKQVRAEVTTATAMPESFFTQIQQELERGTGKKVLLTRKQDPAIIGGVITRMGDRVLDGSLRTRLAELQDTLLER